MGYRGWAIFCDGDMIAQDDIFNLWRQQDDQYAAMVVKHNYKTTSKRKYIGSGLETVNPDYPRKNWSSVILWNCAHPSNLMLTPSYVMDAKGSQLHRFAHLMDDEIGSLDKDWNWLVGEYPANPEAKLLHYTLGVPGLDYYKACDQADAWHAADKAANYIET
jgi:hypothetical protein